MLDNSVAMAGLNTDYEIATILSNFSDDFIKDTITSTINEYRYKPFGLRAPNYPEILENQFANIKLHSTGYDNVIEEKRLETFEMIISTICEIFGLVVAQEIPDQHVYSLAQSMYTIFGSEFTERFISFCAGYIITNSESLIMALSPEDRVPKTPYTKKMYTDQNSMIIFDNIDKIIEIIAGLDIPMQPLVAYLADENISRFICSYIADTGDLYKNHFASFLINPSTRTDMLTSIKLRYASWTIENNKILETI